MHLRTVHDTICCSCRYGAVETLHATSNDHEWGKKPPKSQPPSPAGADIYPCLARKSKKTFALLLVSNEGFMVQRL